MSASAACISCPLCLYSGVFQTAQSLRDRLIYVSTNNIECPICREEVVGLDKLTIHLFTHVTIIPSYDIPPNKPVAIQRQKSEIKQEKRDTPLVQTKKSKTSAPKNSTTSSLPSPQLKFVKIYPKLPAVALSTMPVINSNTNCGNSPLVIATKKDLIEDNLKNKCSVCGVLFINEEILKMHNSLIHNIEEKVECNAARYNCHLCTKSFKMRGSLMVHLRVAHYGFTAKNKNETKFQNDQSNDCEITNSNENDKAPEFILRNDVKQWQCDICNKFFTTKYFLKKHKRLHTG
ncbi:unnamed protein product [Leptidea sinapis]|uniref:C2H2-type domain-containing protein n=1 Tax=Leptidea sinapis TaxID=189913 RepID=A0A5E4PPR1_9NEOP|nr:unnamed protein product [Leptidea sinapis]